MAVSRELRKTFSSLDNTWLIFLGLPQMGRFCCNTLRAHADWTDSRTLLFNKSRNRGRHDVKRQGRATDHDRYSR